MNPTTDLVTLGIVIFAIALAGGLGSVLRLFSSRLGGWLPWGILLANAAGAFLVGLIQASPAMVIGLVITIGFAGGLSTYSAFVAQTADLFSSKRATQALVNTVGTLIFSSTAFWLGQLAGTAMLK